MRAVDTKSDDLTMLEYCGFPVVMNKAIQLSERVTFTKNKDGVGHILEELLEGEFIHEKSNI
ncbi:hypothetical protein HRF87_21930 [Bacillus sp. CRN 9]|nr:hypothetical protein [Bacillus sp. CRN 9]